MLFSSHNFVHDFIWWHSGLYIGLLARMKNNVHNGFSGFLEWKQKKSIYICQLRQNLKPYGVWGNWIWRILCLFFVLLFLVIVHDCYCWAKLSSTSQMRVNIIYLLLCWRSCHLAFTTLSQQLLIWILASKKVLHRNQLSNSFDYK